MEKNTNLGHVYQDHKLDAALKGNKEDIKEFYKMLSSLVMNDLENISPRVRSFVAERFSELGNSPNKPFVLTIRKRPPHSVNDILKQIDFGVEVDKLMSEAKYNNEKISLETVLTSVGNYMFPMIDTRQLHNYYKTYSKVKEINRQIDLEAEEGRDSKKS